VNVEQFASDDEFNVKFQVVLQTWPLYRVFAYTGADLVTVIPKFLSLFCDNCQKETFWETYTSVNASDRGGFHEKTYKCRNCGSRSTIYYFYWKKLEKNVQFFKVGQWPELEETVSDTLVNALTPEDLKMYKNALRLRNFNLGIASMAYMRRVVENRMNDMLDVLHEAARAHNAPAEVLAKHEEIKKDKRFSVKVDYAGDLLPPNLRPAGHPNPIAVLHELTSDGLHAKSDAECVDIFDECRQTFEYVFGKMRIEAEEALAFVKGIAKLTEKRAKAAEPKPAGKAVEKPSL
jgi:hypothetical protein